MQKFRSTILTISNITNGTGGVMLVLMNASYGRRCHLALSRNADYGTFELNVLCRALVAGLAIAQTSLDGAHVNVDLLTEMLHSQQRDVVLVFNQIDRHRNICFCSPGRCF